MPSHADGPLEQVPLKQITGEGLLRAVEAEAEALRVIHVRIQKQLQNLEVEEKLLQHMVNGVRSRHTSAELESFDQQYAQGQLQQRQRPPPRQQPAQQPPGQEQPQPQPQPQQQEQPAANKLQELLEQHPLLAQQRQHMQGFKRSNQRRAEPGGDGAPAPAPVSGPPAPASASTPASQSLEQQQ